MIQTYTERIKDDVLHIELLAHLDNGWSVSERYRIPIINTEFSQTEKNMCAAKMYDRFNKAIAEYILKPQSEGTLPPTKVNSKAKTVK